MIVEVKLGPSIREELQQNAESLYGEEARLNKVVINKGFLVCSCVTEKENKVFSVSTEDLRKIIKHD